MFESNISLEKKSLRDYRFSIFASSDVIPIETISKINYTQIFVLNVYDILPQDNQTKVDIIFGHSSAKIHFIINYMYRMVPITLQNFYPFKKKIVFKRICANGASHFNVEEMFCNRAIH